MKKEYTKRWKVDTVRLISLVVCAILALIAMYFSQPLLKDNWEIIRHISIIFSMLAGFLMISITTIADSVLKEQQAWRLLSLMKSTIEARLIRYSILFSLYIVTLAMARAVQFLKEMCHPVVTGLQYVFLWSSAFLLLLSVGFPFAVAQMQRERYEAALDRERPEAMRRALKQNDE